MGTRYVALGKETIYGTAVAAMRYAEAVASIKPDQSWIIPASVGSRAVRKRALGPYRARGNIGDFPVEPENIIGELLLGVFGSVSSVQQGGTSAYLHTFSPAESLPSYTVRLGVEQAERVLPGGLVESLTVKFKHDDVIKATAEILSGFPETRASINTPSISTLQPFDMQATSAVLSINGSSKRSMVYDLELTVKNNIPFDRGALDGRTFSTKRYGQREVTGKLSAYFDDTSEYDRFIAGNEFTLLVTAVGPLIAGSYYYQLGFELRKCVYLRESAPDVKVQNEPLVIDAPFQAFYDTSGGFNAEAKATLQNAITSY
ncbi:MAG: phage tail tube protein [Candidatus Bathyarchaeota archaeon]|nr:phage tail tube protein [Candidatus Bathyarchaeota archaeon]